MNDRRSSRRAIYRDVACNGRLQIRLDRIWAAVGWDVAPSAGKCEPLALAKIDSLDAIHGIAPAGAFAVQNAPGILWVRLLIRSRAMLAFCSRNSTGSNFDSRRLARRAKHRDVFCIVSAKAYLGLFMPQPFSFYPLDFAPRVLILFF